jgi:hypothetical protein
MEEVDVFDVNTFGIIFIPQFLSHYLKVYVFSLF